MVVKMQKILCHHHIQIPLQTQERNNKISFSFSELSMLLHLPLHLKQLSRNHHVRCPPTLFMSHSQKTLRLPRPGPSLHQQLEHLSSAWQQKSLRIRARMDR